MKTKLNNQPLDQTQITDLDQNAPDQNAPATSLPVKVPAAECPSASAQLLRNLELKRLKALQRKQRADSFLKKLTHAQLARLLVWFEDEKDVLIVHHYVTSPAPDGLGLKVSTSTLRRIRSRIVATHSKVRTTEILDTLSEMDPDPSQSIRIQGAINQLLHEKAFEIIRTEPGSDHLRDLLDTIQKLSALDLKRQKLALDREKMLRRAHQASTPPPPRKHQVELKIVPATPAPEKFDARQPVDIVAPVVEVICN